MRGLLVLLLVASLLAACMAYFRGERYTCFSPGGVDKCKPPPYHHPPVLYPAPLNPEQY